MNTYCKRCKIVHSEKEICPYYLEQLKKNPAILTEAANFVNVAGQYHLITAQTLDGVAQGVNKIAGTSLNFEGTHQFIRDVQVFKQLNIDTYSRSGVFSSAHNAQTYVDHATKGQLDLLTKKLNGTGQEVDWLRWKQGNFSSLAEKSKLLGEEFTNAPGVDGVTVNRFTGDEISRITIKAAESNEGLGTNISDVLKALKNGTLDPKDTLAGIEGTDKAINKALEKNIEKALNNGDLEFANKLEQAQRQLKVQELNNTDTVRQSTGRLKDKIVEGQAHSNVNALEVSKKACQGAIVGAAVGLTISGITNYLKYKNGEISEKDAFQAVGQDTVKGALIGGAMGAITIFLPVGALGFVAGVAVGIYLNRTLTNVLDEVFGKGAFLEILHASGYVYGMATSLESNIKKIEKNEIEISANVKKVKKKMKKIDNNLDTFDSILKGDI